MGLGFWGFRVWGLGLKVLGLGFRAEEWVPTRPKGPNDLYDYSLLCKYLEDQ